MCYISVLKTIKYLKYNLLINIWELRASSLLFSSTISLWYWNLLNSVSFLVWFIFSWISTTSFQIVSFSIFCWFIWEMYLFSYISRCLNSYIIFLKLLPFSWSSSSIRNFWSLSAICSYSSVYEFWCL